MITKAIKKYLEKCPLFSGKEIKLNHLGENPVSFSYEQAPTGSLIKKYVDGGSQRQVLFILASREEYTPNDWKQMEIADFYEQLQNWFEEQNAKKTLPKLGDGLKALRLEVTTSGYLMSNDTRTARYQIQCRLIYYNERM